MDAAAWLMTSIQEGRLLLLPTCESREIAAHVPALSLISDFDGLVLNSLLVPAEVRMPQPHRVRFAHLLFHEFFLARYLVTHPDVLGSLDLPKETRAFVQEMTSSMTTSPGSDPV